MTPDPDVAALAATHGLRLMGGRPALGSYLVALWNRRHFIWTFSRAKVSAANSQHRLGALWNILTPILNTVVYFLIFGVLLQTSRGVTNFLSFLVIGVFIFGFTQGSVTAGARAISGNMGLIRALHFPRAVLPISTTIQQFINIAWSLPVMAAIVLIQREPLTWWWLLAPVALFLQFLFNLGLAFVLARAGATNLDLQQLLPFLTRLWFYVSGVFYSIQVFTERFHAGWIKAVLEANPAAVYIELMRDCLLDSYQSTSHAWLFGVLWAVVMLPVGLIYFWRAEASYGRG